MAIVVTHRRRPLESPDRAVDGREPFTPAKVALMLGLLGFLAFVPALGNDFVAWDDPDNFIDNVGFRGVGWRNLRWAWTTMIIGVYQPVAWMLIEVQYLFTGLEPYGYHLASALMHGLVSASLFYLTLALVRRCRPDLAEGEPTRLLAMAGLAVALWAVHPLRTEVVAWASAQPYLPCAFFSILSVLAYLRANPEGGPFELAVAPGHVRALRGGRAVEGGGDPPAGGLPRPRRLSDPATRRERGSARPDRAGKPWSRRSRSSGFAACSWWRRSSPGSTTGTSTRSATPGSRDG